MTNDKKIKYFLYARKSSENEDRQVQSIDDQINRLKELANTFHLEIKEVLIEAMSAKKPGCRPVFDRMLERIENKEADGILCWEINRLSRNPVDSGRISWMLQQGTLRSIQTIDRQYLPDDNVLLFNVESGMANQFIIDLRKNSGRGMLSKAQKGLLPCRVGIGYLNDPIEKTIIIDPERFPIVRKMWDLMLTGNYTPAKILAIANGEWGLRTPKHRRSGGVEFSIGGIYRMFSNFFYTGSFYWAGNLYKGEYKAMITDDEFDKVQVILGRKSRPRPQKHAFAYTGIMRCADCGSMFTAIEKTKLIKKTRELKTFTYYHCTRKKKGVKCNQNKPVTLDELEKKIDKKLQEITIIPKFQQWAIEILNRNNDKEVNERTKIYEAQHKAVVETQAQLDNLIRMRYRGLIDDDAFLRERDPLQEKLTKLKVNLHGTENRAEKWIELSEKAFNFATYARTKFLLGGLDTKREIFAALGENFLVKDKEVSLTRDEWFIPIEKRYPAIEAEYNRLELDKKLSVNAKTKALASVLTSWSG